MIGRATTEDAAEIGRIFLATRDRMTYLPRIPDGDRPKLGGWIVDRHEVWVVEEGGRIVGFAGLDPDKLEHLYVDPEAQNCGVGLALFDHAKTQRPDGFDFWVFQQNEGARRFYERHGCRLVKLTDGADNMEKTPDALYEWRPET